MNIDNEKNKLKNKIKCFDEQIGFLQKQKAQLLAKIHALNLGQGISSPLASRYKQVQNNILLLKQYFRGQENVYARLFLAIRKNSLKPKRFIQIEDIIIDTNSFPVYVPWLFKTDFNATIRLLASCLV